MDLHGRIMNLPFVAPPDVSAYKSECAAKLGHRDARHAAAELALKADADIEQAARALRALLEGCEFRSIGGEAPAWHLKSMPRDSALTMAREALAALDGRVFVSG